jgi:hypothetical protein
MHIRRRQRGRGRSRREKGGRQRATVSIGQLLDLGEAETFLACILGMRDGRQSSLVQPQTQGFGIDAEQGTNVRERKKIHSMVLLSRDEKTEREGAEKRMRPRDSWGNSRQSQGNFQLLWSKVLSDESNVSRL